MATSSKNSSSRGKAKSPQSKSSSGQRSKKAALEQQAQSRREITAIVFFVIAIFGFLCWFNSSALLIGPLAKLIGGLFGQVGRYLLPLLLIYAGIILFRSHGAPVRLRVWSLFITMILISSIVHILGEIFGKYELGFRLKDLFTGGHSWKSGGLIPGLLAEFLHLWLMKLGALIILSLAAVLFGFATQNITVSGVIRAMKKREPQKAYKPQEDPSERFVNHVAEKQRVRAERRSALSDFDIPIDDPPLAKPEKPRRRNTATMSPAEYLEQKQAQERQIDLERQQVTIDEIELHDPIEPAPRRVPASSEQPMPLPVVEEPVQPESVPIPPVTQPEITPAAPVPTVEKVTKGEAAKSAMDISQEISEHSEPVVDYVFPTIDLLNQGRSNSKDATGEMRENSKRLADALQSFGVAPHIVDVIRGPSVTRYEIELDPGVKLSKITNLSEDIALALGAQGVRISAIPDKISVVGIEVPNKIVNTVFAREVIGSDNFANSKSKVSFAVGKDISGNCIIGDIGKMPHMLIAGTTGSGKSVCMNSLIISLLYKAKPDEVKLIMVDPKMVELGNYNGIPHLLIPVVTDPKKAAGALQWAVTEMLRRYRLMSDEGVRDIESFNKAAAYDPDQDKLPQIVVVIDELADLMLVAAKEVEESICRIAQMGRAAGIHLVIATQRPSADVITGTMKANIPSRIAFSVSSAMESRIILDMQGAEKLVGKGDMLFAPHGQGKPQRVQGCFITDDEVANVVNSVKANTQSAYSADIMEQIEKRAEQSGKSTASESAQTTEDAEDEMLPAAVEVILETGQASVSMLQRRLKLGYARAARIVDKMEEKGIVGPFEGAKPRQLLITREQWEQMKNGSVPPAVEEEIP